MNHALLGAALVAVLPLAFTAPASAHSLAATSISASAGARDIGVGSRAAGHRVRVHRGSDGPFSIRFANASSPGHFGHGRDYGYGGGYYDEGDYDANRSFDADKWNDWWHERPERSFPRWVWRNRGCTEDRMWWSGAGWRCTP